MKKRENIFGKLLLILMIASVLITGCGSSGLNSAEAVVSDAFYSAKNAAQGAYEGAQKAAGYAADTANEWYDEAVDTAESFYEGPVAEEAANDEGYEGYDQGTGDGIKAVASAGNEVVLDSEKIVYHADISVSSKNFDHAREQIKEAAEKYGAVLQTENYNENDIGWYMRGDESGSNRRYYYVEYRVPTQNYNDMLSETGNMDAVVNYIDTSAVNITQQYSDVEAEIEALEAELKQLKDIMKDAKKVEDVLYIQERITEVLSALNRNKSNLKRMDTDVAYSYVNISLQEVAAYKEPEPSPNLTYEEKLMKNFYNSIIEFENFCYDFVLYAVRNWIKILAVIIILIIVISIFRGGKDKRAIRKEVKKQYKENKKEEKRLRKEAEKAINKKIE